MYTLKEFKDGCHFNLFLGAMVGVVFTLGAELLFVWTYGV